MKQERWSAGPGPIPGRADHRAGAAHPAGMSDMIRDRMRDGTSVLLTTQYLEEADELAHTIAVVDAGRIIARGTADELKARVGGERIELVVRDRADLGRAVQLPAPVDRRDVTLDEHTRRTVAACAQRCPAAGRGHSRTRRGQYRNRRIGLHRPTLDDVFLSLTGRGTASSLAGEDEAIGGRVR